MNETLVLEAVRKTVTVDCSVEEAFRVFTSEVASWWPTETHSIHGDRVKDVVFEEHVGGEVYEISADGRRARWATVVAFEPPRRVVVAWEVSEKSLGTEVEVRFTAQGEQTQVDLEHRGWENVKEPAERGSYDTGWEYVLARYVGRAW